MTRVPTQKELNTPASSGVDRRELRQRIASFFKERRQASGMTVEQVASALPGNDVEQLRAFEAGAEAIPLDLIFSLTNLYNIPPEDTLNLIHDVYGEQARK